MVNLVTVERIYQSLTQTIHEKVRVLNLYDTKSSDPVIIRREILTTRLFILLIIMSVVILTGYTLISEHNRIETIKQPTVSVYKYLQRNYPETLQCPCEKVSIPYRNFLNTNASFHQVCNSQFVSQSWIDYVFVTNSSSIWPMDVRTSLNSMWQLIKILCQKGKFSTIDAIDQFMNSPLISSMTLSEQLLNATIESSFDQILQTTSSALIRPLIALNGITQSNELTTALSINYIAVTSAFDEYILALLIDDLDITVGMTYNRYIFNGSTTYCSCTYNGSCPMHANLYLYNVWEQYGVYDFNTIEINATLPGIIIDCLPIQTILASTLECFYQQSCLNLIITVYQKPTNISILDQSSSSRYSPTTPIEVLIKNLFIEKIEKQILYDEYYLQCAPTYCTYSYSRRFDLIYVITTLLALFGGLTAALRLITPFIIYLILFIKNRRSTTTEQKSQQSQNPSIRTGLINIVDRVKTRIIELNLFNTYSRDALRIRRERFTTRLFIILFAVALCVLIFYTSLVTYTIVKTIQSPTEEQYKMLLEFHSTTLQCPCTVFSIPHAEFTEIFPEYHQICQSDFIQSWWHETLFFERTADYTDAFAPIIASYFRTLTIFCEIANLTVIEAIRQFSSTIFVNAYVLPPYLFNSRVNASISIFKEMARAEFLYTMSVIGKLIEGNQYISNRMGSTIVYKYYYPELTQFNLSSVRFISYTKSHAYENGVYCHCAFDSKCDVERILTWNGISENLFSNLTGIRYGCFVTDSVLKSALLCWYMTDCIQEMFRVLRRSGHNISLTITPLNSQLPSRFQLNSSTEVIFNELMIEQWHSSISYEKFYQKCNPSYCSYSYNEKSNIALMVTTIIGFIGGLNVFLRLISPFIINIFFQCINKTKSNRSKQAWTMNEDVTQNHSSNVSSLKTIFQFRQQLIELNLFDSESTNETIIKHERLSTRVYLFILTICIVSITVGSIISKQSITISIRSPTQFQYEQLLNSHSLHCPCSQVSIPHKNFITINATFHQVCSSGLVEYWWHMYLFVYEYWHIYERGDIRGRGTAYFTFLKSMCELSQTTVSNLISQFLTDTFVGGQTIPELEFRAQINALTQRFETITPKTFSQILIFLNEMAQASGFISSFFLNWDWWMAFNTSVPTLPTRPVIFDNGCSCGTQNDCTQPGGIYVSLSNNRVFTIPGWNIGCSTVDTVLRSTLECFYNQSCIDSLYYYMSTVDYAYPFEWNTPSLKTNVTSRFQQNTIIQEIVEKLFVEQWFINISYTKFYEECAPIYCSYTIQESNDFSFILASILGLYGGITVALRLIVPRLLEIIFIIRNRFCRNTIHPRI